MPKQELAFELFYDGTWRDIAADDDVFTSAPIVLRRGQGDESPAPRPAQITAELANDDDRYRASNPESPLYGKAGRNTPARVAVGGSVRGVVEASSWACDQSQDFRQTPRRGRAWTEFEGGGLLQRIGQWTEPLKSAFRQYNEGLGHVTMYFPCEQPATTLVPVPTFSGPEGFAFSGGVTFDSSSYPPSSGPLMDVSKSGGVNLYTNTSPSSTSTDGWQVSWVQRLEPLESNDAFLMSWNTDGGGGSGDAFQLTILPSTGEINLQGSNGSVFLSVTKTTDNYDFTQWSMFTADATYSGGTTTLYVNWTNADNTESRFMSGTYSHEPGTFNSIANEAGRELDNIPEGSTFGHFLAVDVGSSGGVDLFGTARIYAWTGYLGEKAAYRFDRLCDLKGIPNFVSTNYELSMPMGPQPIATLAEHLREIATTEDGLISDFRTQSRLYLICRYDRYNQTPALELVPEDLPALPREVTDDLGVHNIVTASQRDGADVTAEDSNGPLGSQAPPDGVGEYRQTVDVNVSAPAARLPDIANWWLRRGTVNLPRYPQVVVDLAALSPSKVSEVEAVDVGDVITISGFREDVIRLHVLGYTEVVGTHSRKITFVCAPDQQFDVARYDDTDKRYDSRTSTLSTAYDAAAASMVVTFTNLRDAWSTTGTPYDWAVTGERITVTSMGAVAGSGPWTQTATVKRSVNGVRKGHAAGEPVHMNPDQQARYAL